MPPRPEIAVDWLNGDIADLRARYEQAYALSHLPASRWESIDAGGHDPRLLIHDPPGVRPGGSWIVYFHGGGWIVGSPATHADISLGLSKATSLRLASVDYRLAPEHPAPAPVDDGLAAVAHLLRQPGTESIVVCGDSAGASIALAVERQADAQMRQRIAGVAAFYGCFGLLDSPSLQLGSRAEGLDAACVRRMWSLANPAGRISPYSIETLAALSPVPAYLLAAGADPLRDDTLALARKSESRGRNVVLDVVDGESHGFLHSNDSPSAIAAFHRVGSWIDSIT